MKKTDDHDEFWGASIGDRLLAWIAGAVLGGLLAPAIALTVLW